MTPRGVDSPDAKELIDNRMWTALHDNYIVPTSVIPFGQLAFLERVRHETPNFISYLTLVTPMILRIISRVGWHLCLLISSSKILSALKAVSFESARPSLEVSLWPGKGNIS